MRANHYLKDAKFFSERQYGLYIGDNLMGVATYSRPQGNVALKGWFGLTDKKKDFYRFDGKKNPRGSTKSVRGVWVNRSQKHRYAVIMDKSLVCNYEEKEYPKQGEIEKVTRCFGKGKIWDNRFGEEWDCPVCNNKRNEDE